MAEVSIDAAHMAVTVKAGIGGRVWLSFHEITGEASLTYRLDGFTARSIASTIEYRGESAVEEMHCFAKNPDEAVCLRLGKTSVWMGIEEADDLAESIRKALAWKEAHP